MPDPNSVSPGYSSNRIDLSGAPAADQDWDSLFPNPELTPAPQPQATAPGTTPQQQPQATPAPFLKAGETVYNTAEDAAAGVAHKDTVIAKYRSFLANNGLDPNAVLKDDYQAPPRPQVAQASAQQASPYKHYGNPNFFDEVAAAATAKDKVKYEELMRSYNQEAIAANLDPWKTVLAETNRYRAIRQASAEVPKFNEFMEGPGYRKVLDSFPLYKDMVQLGESDPRAAERLPEVYKSMYLIYQGMNQSQAQPQAPNVTPTTPTVRSQPTLQPSALTPPAPVVSTQGWQESSWRGNKPTGNEARKQLIQDGDNRYRGMRFEDVGL